MLLLVRHSWKCLIDPEDEGSPTLRNVGNYLPVDTALHFRRLLFSITAVRKSSRRPKVYCVVHNSWHGPLPSVQVTFLHPVSLTAILLLLSKLTDKVYNRSLRYRILFRLYGPVIDGKGSFTLSITLYVEFDIAELTCVLRHTLFDSLNSSKIMCVFLCFVDRASRYIHIMKTKLMHYLSSVYFVSQSLHVSGIFVAHHQEVYCIYTTIGTYCASWLSVWISIPTRTRDNQLKSTIRTNCCIHTVHLLMIGYKYARNMYRLTDEINWG
jgi:hypothetical protein